MTVRLTAGIASDAAALPSDYEPVEAARVVSGEPSTRYVELDTTPGRTIAVWEHTEGVSIDVEADEVFVVLTGDATLEFTEPALPAIELRPGTIVRLEEGMHTIWTVRETLRKVFVAP